MLLITPFLSAELFVGATEVGGWTAGSRLRVAEFRPFPSFGEQFFRLHCCAGTMHVIRILDHSLY